jgi:type I restriction enzyme S subunit
LNKQDKSLQDNTQDLIFVPENEQPYTIPDHWHWLRLKSCVSKLQYGYTQSSTNEPIGPKFLRITDIQDNDVNWDSVPYCQITEDDASKYKLLSNDIVVARTGATTGKSFLITNPPDSVFASYLIRLSPTDVMYSRFLWFFMNTPCYWSQITTVSKGIAQPGANATLLGDLAIPLPPKDEQVAIVERIESLMGKVKNAEGLLGQAKETYQQQRNAVVARTLRGELTASWRASNFYETAQPLVEEVHRQRDKIQQTLYGKRKSKLNVEGVSAGTEPYVVPDSWVWERIGNIAVNVVDGTHHTPQYTDSGVPFLSVKDVKNNQVSFEDTKYISEDEHRELIKRCHPEKGDILITKSGTIGRTAVVATEQEFSLFVSVALIKLAGLSLEPRFVELALEFFVNQEIGKEFVKGSAVKNLHLDQIVKLPIPVPPLHEQKRIVEILNSITTSLNSYVNVVEEIEQKLNVLEATILSTAFRGRLCTRVTKVLDSVLSS